MSSYDPERVREGIDPALEEGLEVMADNILDLVEKIRDVTNLNREKVVALGVVTLYHQLQLRKAGKVVIVADGASTEVWQDPLAAITSFVKDDDFADVLHQLRGPDGE
jgi:hypothetical protein